jgi:hypothetical protein
LGIGSDLMMRCDVCGTIAKCVQKEIEGKEYDICEPCWNPLGDRLSGKGRSKTMQERHKYATDAVEEYEEVVY